MQKENVNNVVCDAEENDWLDITYTQRNYLPTEQPKKAKSSKRIPKGLKILAVVVLCVAIFGGMLLIDGNFSKEVFATVKSVYSSVIGVFQPTEGSNVITVPVNVDLIDSLDGISTFGGGKATLSFTEGTVQSVDETSVCVALSEEVTITYTNLTSVFVKVGDLVATNSLLGKYDGTFSTVISQNGEVVKQVVASDTQLVWQA